MATPRREDHGPLVGVQKVLALDFSSKVTGPRKRRLDHLPDAFLGELHRTNSILHLSGDHALPAAAMLDLHRSKGISDRAVQLLGSELSRRPTSTKAMWPSSFELAKNTANGFDSIGRMLGSDQYLMSDISDSMHRTDHTDRRPELTLWQRLQRRLPW